jgi:hypothetical protein
MGIAKAIFVYTFFFFKIKSHWGTLVPRINVESGIKFGFVLE